MLRKVNARRRVHHELLGVRNASSMVYKSGAGRHGGWSVMVTGERMNKVGRLWTTFGDNDISNSLALVDRTLRCAFSGGHST